MNYNECPVLVNLMQAMLGSVTPNWRAVFVKNENDELLLTFVLAVDSPDDRDEIEEVVFEFEALEPSRKTSISVLVDRSPLASLAERGQLVFARKE